MSDTYKAKEAYQNRSVAEEYDQVRFSHYKGRLTNLLEKRVVLKALSSVPCGSTVLDIPCGTGRVTEWLLEKGYKTTGLDISSEMAKQAKVRLEYFDNLQGIFTGDASRLQFNDNAFDCVVSIRLLGHTPPTDRLQIIEEIRRVSSDFVILAYYHAHCLQGYRKILIAKLSGKNRIWYPISAQDMAVELDQVGLKIVGVYPLFKFISETWIILARKKCEISS